MTKEIGEMFLEKEKSDAINVSVSELLQANERLWNAILTINGIFLSFLAVLSTTDKIDLWILLVVAVLTAVPMIGILYKFFIILKTSSKRHELVLLLNTIKTEDHQKTYDKSKNGYKDYCIRHARYQKFINPTLLICTFCTIFFEFIIIIFIMVDC